MTENPLADIDSGDDMPNQWSRRDFLGVAAGTAAAALTEPRAAPA